MTTHDSTSAIHDITSNGQPSRSGPTLTTARTSFWPAPDATRYDVAIVGGGAGGLGAALVLGRSRRRVIVVDGGEPRNAPAAHMHGYLTRDGMNPAEFLELGRAEVRGYGVEIMRGTISSVDRQEGAFTLVLADGSTLRARRLLVTTGLVDTLPNIPGLRERWGRDVLHCPYCHGYEVRDRPLGVIAPSLFRVQHAPLIRQWSADVTVFPHTLTPDEIPAADRERLAAVGIRLVEGIVAGLRIEDDRVTGVQMTSGDVVPVRAVFSGLGFEARDSLLLALGAATTDTFMGAYVATDPFGLTSVPGVWAAGNVTSPSVQVIDAASAGSRAAAAINLDLVHEDTECAVHDRQAHSPQPSAV